MTGRLPGEERLGPVYWWDAASDCWRLISWDNWVASLWWQPDGRTPEPLYGVASGDIHLVVCVRADDGSIANIIPHRYEIDGAGYRRRHGGEQSLTDEERAFERAWYLDQLLTRDEAQDRRHDEIQEKLYRWLLPPAGAARALLRTLPPPSMKPEHGVWHFAGACGVFLPPSEGRQ